MGAIKHHKMIVINTTFFVESDKAPLMLRWLKETYIPQALGAGIKEVRATEVIEPVEEGVTAYAVALWDDDEERARQWHDGPASELREKLTATMMPQPVFFTTYMREI